MIEKTVMVSGCYDLIHAGHIVFLKEASSYGKLIVCVGSDENIRFLKNHDPLLTQEERIYILNSIKYVDKAIVSSGSGMLDFEPDLAKMKPDYFIVNADGHTEAKKVLCEKYGVEYIVLERIPEKGLPDRNSTSLKECLIKIDNNSHELPFRICLAGGWIDQPWVSEIHPGSVTVVNIHPTIKFNNRSGMATSSRKIIKEIWGNKLPNIDPERLAKIVFGAENPPGVEYVSGSQDQLGLALPGVSRLFYDGGYWPSKIDNNRDPEIAEWLERVINLVPLKPRPDVYNPLVEKKLSYEWAKILGEAATLCYNSIINKDIEGFGKSLTMTLKSWEHILPYTVNEDILTEIDKYSSHTGALFSGSGGGYIIVISDRKIDEALKIKVRY